MRRVASAPRADWQSKVEAAGLIWHTQERPYWNEAAFYEFTAPEADTLEAATNELARMALAAVQHIIDQKLYSALGIPEFAIPLVEESWKAGARSVYGRFDLAWTGKGAPKLLEYNADTPTSLLEAAVVQWYWLEELHRGADQFNSIHEKLIGAWKGFAGRVDFVSTEDPEDEMTVAYLMDTARQAGVEADRFLVGEIGWDGARFTGPDDRALATVFKLYPWEWMLGEEFGAYLNSSETVWIEPAWKMLLSNKGLLPVLWEMFPGHENLLEASWSEPDAGRAWVRKPMLGREGANVTMHRAGGDLATPGNYGEGRFVYQDLAELRCFEGKYAVVGSWVVGDEAAGLGIRESEIPITTNLSQFVPHLLG